MSMKELVGELAKESARTVLPFPVAAVFVYLIGEVVKDKGEIERVDQRLAKLQQIVEQQQKLIEQQMLNHYKSGIIYLSEAQNAFGTQSQRAFVHEYLHDAQKEFTEATLIELPEYPLIPIKASFYVGVCHDLSQDKAGALNWYEKAHNAVVTFIRSVRPALRSSLPELRRQLRIIDEASPSNYLDKRRNAPSTPDGFSDYRSIGYTFSVNDLVYRNRKYGPLTMQDYVGTSRSGDWRDPTVRDDVTGRDVRVSELMQRERNLIVAWISDLENSVDEPIDRLLDPDNFDLQSRESSLSRFQELGYFEGWNLRNEDALDAETWALSLTHLIASRRPNVLTSPG